MRKVVVAIVALLVCLSMAESAHASACYVGPPNAPNRVTAGGFVFIYQIRFLGTGAGAGDVPGGSQDTEVTVTYLSSQTAQQRRDALFAAIQAAATALGLPIPNRTACAGFYDMAVGTL